MNYRPGGQPPGSSSGLDHTWLVGEHAYRRACIEASLGERGRAVELSREALAQRCALGIHLHTSLALQPLSDYPPFVELIRPKG